MEPLIAAGLAFWVTVIGGGFYFVRRYVRAIERRGSHDETHAELQSRVTALEQIVDGLQSDVGRLEEGHEFTAKLLNRGARTPESPA